MDSQILISKNENKITMSRKFNQNSLVQNKFSILNNRQKPTAFAKVRNTLSQT